MRKIRLAFGHFNPLAPRGARHNRGSIIHYQFNFNPLAPRGARLDVVSRVVSAMLFQSTRPSRGETVLTAYQLVHQDISIHSPLAGRDYISSSNSLRPWIFQSTRPSRGETEYPPWNAPAPLISIHSPLAGRDWWAHRDSNPKPYFNPLAPRGARRLFLTNLSPNGTFQSTRPSRGETPEKKNCL